MKHVGLVFAALLATVAGFLLILWVKPLTTLNTILGVVFIAFALWCSAMAEMKAFGDACSGWYRAFKKGGAT